MRVIQYAGLMMWCCACAPVGMLATGGLPWWGYVIVVWASCFIVTMGLIWHEQRRWAQVDAATDE